MKARIPGLIKRFIAALSAKTNELRTRVMIFILLHSNQSLLIDKFHSVIANHQRRRHAYHNAGENSIQNGNKNNDDESAGESFILYMNTDPIPTTKQVFSYPQENPEDSCIDLTHVLLKESEKAMELAENEDATKESDGEGNGSTNTMTMNLEDSKNGELEEEDIDQAADLFIERFKRQIQLQKQLSLRERQSRSAMLQPNT